MEGRGGGGGQRGRNSFWTGIQMQMTSGSAKWCILSLEFMPTSNWAHTQGGSEQCLSHTAMQRT